MYHHVKCKPIFISIFGPLCTPHGFIKDVKPQLENPDLPL